MSSALEAPAPHGPRYQIHHYPAGLIDTRALGALGRLTLRPVLPQDHVLLGDLVHSLSPAGRRNRFHGAMNLSPGLLQRMAQVDYRRELALVIAAATSQGEQLIADARYCVADDGQSAEFAVMVHERWQRCGVGSWALRVLQQAAGHAGLQWLQGDVLQGNVPMLGLMQRCGFALSPHPDDPGVVLAQRRLPPPGQAVEPPPRTTAWQRWRRAWPAALSAWAQRET
jgi:acetyltransferase